MFELLVVVEGESDFSFAVGIVFECDGGVESRREVLFEDVEIIAVVTTSRGGLWFFSRGSLALAICFGEFFDATDGEVVAEDFVVEFELESGVGDGENSASVTHVEAFVAQSELDFRGKFEETKEVGHGGAFFADALAESFLGEVILVD